LRIKINPIANFLSLALADTGQLIHPGIMYGLFHDWNGRVYDKPSYSTRELTPVLLPYCSK